MAPSRLNTAQGVKSGKIFFKVVELSEKFGIKANSQVKSKKLR